MKTTITNHFVFDIIDAPRRAQTIVPRRKPQTTPLMKKLRIVFLLMLLGAAAPLLLQAQPTDTDRATPVPDAAIRLKRAAVMMTAQITTKSRRVLRLRSSWKLV